MLKISKPAQSTPAQSTPAQSTPAQSTPAQSTPTQPVNTAAAVNVQVSLGIAQSCPKGLPLLFTTVKSKVKISNSSLCRSRLL